MHTYAYFVFISKFVTITDLKKKKTDTNDFEIRLDRTTDKGGVSCFVALNSSYFEVKRALCAN